MCFPIICLLISCLAIISPNPLASNHISFFSHVSLHLSSFSCFPASFVSMFLVICLPAWVLLVGSLSPSLSFVSLVSRYESSSFICLPNSFVSSHLSRSLGASGQVSSCFSFICLPSLPSCVCPLCLLFVSLLV